MVPVHLSQGEESFGVFSTGHLTSGVAVGLALGFEGPALAAFVLASVFTDWDYSLAMLTGKNHRYFWSHCPPVVAAVLLPLGFWDPLAWYVLGGAMLHFSLDLWDFGLRLNPFSRRIYGARLLDVAEDADFRTYVRAYFRDRRFLVAEVAFAVAAGGWLVWRLGWGPPLW